MPPVTMDEASWILTGLMVVRARRKAIMPMAAIHTPKPTNAPATAGRTRLSMAIAGVIRASAHIATAMTTATMGGGILFSRARMDQLITSEPASGLTHDGQKWSDRVSGHIRWRRT